MSDRYTELLSGYLDHDLTHAEHAAVQRHLDECEACRTTLAGLAGVKTRAASLEDPPAPTDLWAGIASRIGTAGSSSEKPAPRPVLFELPRRRAAWWGTPWLAAAAAFLLVASGALWLAHDRLVPALRMGPASGGTTPAPAGGADVSVATFDAGHIEGEIADLQRALDRGRGKLDPSTVRVLEENLRIIHKAAQDARQALERDPANRELQDYLTVSVQRKLEFVRRAASLAGV